MSKDFALSIELDHSVEQVHATLTSDGYWKGRAADSTSGSVETSAPAGPGTIQVHITDETDSAGLPAVVRGILRGPLVMTRDDEWGVVEGGTARGTLTGGTSGLPVTIEARTELRPNGGGSVIDIQGQVTVKVPVVGGQVEGLVLQMVEGIVNADRVALQSALGGK